MASLENESENDLAVIHEESFRKGAITPAGILNDKGELMPRAKPEPRMGLSVEDECTIDQWNKAIKRDFPKLDNTWIDLISTYCYMHPEESRAFALEHASKDPAEKALSMENQFKHLEKLYERVDV